MQHETEHSHCHPPSSRPDYVLWGSLGVLAIAGIYYAFHVHFNFLGDDTNAFLFSFSSTVVDLLCKMALGLVFAVFFVGLMEFVPRAKFHQILGAGNGLNGILRATLAGVLLDLCSHGILLVAMKLYERGVSLGQVVAFLVASPWNSFSMTIILWSLVGLKLTLVFIAFSAVIAVISGLIFNSLVEKSTLPQNPNQQTSGIDQKVPWFEVPQGMGVVGFIKKMILGSLSESKMILRWIFFGIALTALIKGLVRPEIFHQYFGPDVIGVVLTLLAATVLEVCSEGTAPLAAELVTTAKAPGNAFTFLMAGVSTDYTEILALRETTKSWKVALFLPVVTLPQIVILGILLNGWLA